MDNNIENAFTVTPMAQDFILTPGETYEGSITVSNPSNAKEDFNYKTEITPYSVVGAEYAADLATVSNYSAIMDWITIENPTGTIHPNESAVINFKITVPKTAAGGGQYASIAISSKDEPKNQNGVNVDTILEMASVIYGQVDGEITQSGEIKQNDIPGFLISAPIKTSVLLSNDGNIHESALITIKATNFFTGEVISPKDGEDGQYNEVVMPGTERQAEREISDTPFLGVVRVEQTVNYLGQISQTEVNVIICPIWFIVLVLLTIGAFIALIVKMVKKHRRKKAKTAV